VRTCLWLFLCAFMVGCGGCALMDAFFGAGGTGARKPSIIETVVETALNGIFPGSGAVLAGIGGAYAELRRRKWKKAAVSTFDTIEESAKTGKSARDMKADLEVAHNAAGVSRLVNKAVKKYDKPISVER